LNNGGRFFGQKSQYRRTLRERFMLLAFFVALTAFLSFVLYSVVNGPLSGVFGP
jgi:hypothetical protein